MSTGKSKAGREELTAIVQRALNYGTKKEAEKVIDTVVSALEEVLLNNLADAQFTLKLNRFGKFTVKHKPGIYRKIPFTGETKMTNAKRKVKFVTLGPLRQKEVVTQEKTTTATTQEKT
jgi:nucleoid DNA-binding protein